MNMIVKILGYIVALAFCVISSGRALAEPVHNIVLVHGAFADGSGWRPVYEKLVAKGYHVSVVQEPETSLAADIEATRRVLDMQDGPVVLVAHSWGGQIITEAGTHPKVVALVFVAALVPDVGETTKALHARMPAASKAVKALPDGYLMLDPALFQADFAADIPKATAEFMASSQVLIAADALEAPAKSAAWKDKPSFALVPGADRTINPDLQRWMYKRAGSQITEVPGSSHVLFLSHPDKVVTVIEQASKNRAHK